MARVEPLAAKEFPHEMQAALEALMPANSRHPRPSAEGRPNAANVIGTLAHHPELARAYCTFNGHLLMMTTLSERHREMVIMRLAAVRSADYEWVQHLFMAKDAGVDDEEIKAIVEGPDAASWSDEDAAILRAVDDLLVDGSIGSDTWKTLTSYLDTRQILDLIFTAGSYDIMARMCKSLGVEIDEGFQGLMTPKSIRADNKTSPTD
jgi:4-carboxymuconolactone decarboxylase